MHICSNDSVYQMVISNEFTEAVTASNIIIQVENTVQEDNNPESSNVNFCTVGEVGIFRLVYLFCGY